MGIDNHGKSFATEVAVDGKKNLVGLDLGELSAELESRGLEKFTR